MCIMRNGFFVLHRSTFRFTSRRQMINDYGLKWFEKKTHRAPFPDLIEGDRGVSKSRVTFTHGSCVCRLLFKLLLVKHLNPKDWCRRKGGKARRTCRRWKWTWGRIILTSECAFSSVWNKHTHTQRHIWCDEDVVHKEFESNNLDY